jgi:hypothetical protein
MQVWRYRGKKAVGFSHFIALNLQKSPNSEKYLPTAGK